MAIEILETEAVEKFNVDDQHEDCIMTNTSGLSVIQKKEIAMTMIHIGEDDFHEIAYVYFASLPVSESERKIDLSTQNSIEEFVMNNAKVRSIIRIDKDHLLTGSLSSITKRTLITRKVWNLLG